MTRGLGSPGGGSPPCRCPPPQPPAPLARAAARPGGGARSAPRVSPLNARAPATWAARIPARTRTVPATLRRVEPEGTRPHRSPLPLRRSLRRGRRGERLLAPLGDKNPNLRSHHAHTDTVARARTHTRTHTHTLSPPPLPKGVSEERPGVHTSFFSSLPIPRFSFYCIPLNRITMLIKRVILLIVTQEFFLFFFFFNNLPFAPLPSPYASLGPFF